MSSAHSRRVDAAHRLRAPAWKRIEDLVLGIPLTVIALPFLIVIGLAIAAESGGPVFYVDERVGAGGRPFRMIKFRTMVRGAVDQGRGRLVASSDSRITRVGTALRRTCGKAVPVHRAFAALRKKAAQRLYGRAFGKHRGGQRLVVEAQVIA